MNDRLYIKLLPSESPKTDCIMRNTNSYWIDRLLLDDKGMKLSRYTTIGLAKNQRIQEYINNNILTFANYVSAVLIDEALHLSEREIESISIEENRFVIKFKQS